MSTRPLSDPLPPPKKARLGAPDVAHGESALATTTIGGRVVSAIGLGTLPLGVVYPDAARVPDAAGALAIVAAAAAAAAPAALFVDTADTYSKDGSSLHSLERVLSGLPTGAVVLATKTGMSRTNSAESGSWRPGNTSAAGLAKSIAESCAALGAGAPGDAPLFLWQLHHTDGKALVAPGGLETSLGGVWPLAREGRVLNVGICNATSDMLRRAVAAARAAGVSFVSVQNEYSFYCRDAEQEKPPGAAASSGKGVLRAAAELGVVFIAHSPFGGLKARRAERIIARDFPAAAEVAAGRARVRGGGDGGGGSGGDHSAAGDGSEAAVGVAADGAAALAAPAQPSTAPPSTAAVYLAYLLLRARRASGPSGRVIIIAGARTAAHAADSARAARLALTPGEVAALDAAWDAGKGKGGKSK